MQQPDGYTANSGVQPSRSNTPPLMSANVNGPVDPHEFYTSFSSNSSHDQQESLDSISVAAAAAASSPPRPMPGSFEGSTQGLRSYSQSPERARARATHSALGVPSQKLNSAKSQPVLNARPPGMVKDMANKFSQGVVHDDGSGGAVRVPNERYRRPLPSKSNGPKQSTSPRVQKRKPVPSTVQDVNTSFESNNSFSSAATAITSSSQQSQRVPRSHNQPLFGEVTTDGNWNSFDFGTYGLSPDYFRNGNDGNVIQPPPRPRSQNDMLSPVHAISGNERELHHKRSRSDLSEMRPSPTSPDNGIAEHHFFRQLPAQPTTPSSTSTAVPSRIPVRGRRSSVDSQASIPNTPRSASAIPTPISRPRPSRNATQEKAVSPGEQTKPQNRRYNPPTLQQPSQLLSAKVVAPPPKVSPPLRSSRPRQPVSAATTAASRARAASSQQNSPISPSTKRPSEQWLGKPYDPKQDRPRRKIPELGKVDFAERRARIQKAISQNLEENEAARQLAQKARAASKAREMKVQQSEAGAEEESIANSVDQHQAAEFEKETEDLGLVPAPVITSPSKSLKLKTTDLPPSATSETFLDTGGTSATEFEFDEPDNIPTLAALAVPVALAVPPAPDGELLTPATYQAPIKKATKTAQKAVQNDVPEKIEPTSPVDESPSDIEDRWGLKRGLGDHGSIKIMLANDPKLDHLNSMRQGTGSEAEPSSANQNGSKGDVRPTTFDESPIDPAIRKESIDLPTETVGDFLDVLPQTSFRPATPRTQVKSLDDPTIAKAVNEYRATGIVAPELAAELAKHTIDFDRISANGGSDAMLVHSLFQSIAAQQATAPDHFDYTSPVTPHTPPGAMEMIGTAIVYGGIDGATDMTPERRSDDAVVGSDDEDDFAAQIRKADEAWERTQRGEGPMFNEEDNRPPPPPKDVGYTPRSSVGDNSALHQDWNGSGQRLSVARSDDRNASSKNVDSVMSEEIVVPAVAPSLPNHAPPPPPPIPDSSPQLSSNQESSMQSPRSRSRFSTVPSSRPSTDSQLQAPAFGSQSMLSFTDSVRQSSTEIENQSSSKSSVTSPNPDQKRLLKRRNIVRELLDTENTYHQDLKIIEDIYKATVSELVSAEDKKTLFGNCDDIERFSLQFYDQLRKAAAGTYTPAKKQWGGNRRGSMSTTQSDATGQVSISGVEPLDEVKDRTTFIGKIFLNNLATIEQLYGAYLKNHDAANQRLSALQSNSTIKCWLDECHNNASDITSAWDLDSLLVKPTQRVSKYPLLLQSLVDVTPESHPDYDSLKQAAKETVAMLTRINDAKKRADLVESLISGKRKETDVRSGLAKAFGRRTERLKERVGISEAFQDTTFDKVVQSYGGHYIRLQVTMRDFQDYVNRVETIIVNTNNIAANIELFADVHQSSRPEIESKWRRYGQVIRELVNVSLVNHKAEVQRRVIAPLIALIKTHENPQKAINKRKKHIIDYAKCKSIEKRGERPDKKTLEASEMYEALNDQLKIELPKLYELTGKLVMACMSCFVESQQEWQMAWQRKLEPLLDARDVKKCLDEIVQDFTADHEIARARLLTLAVCNGAILADSANYLAPVSVDSDSISKVSTATDSSKTTLVNSETPSQSAQSSRRPSRVYTPEVPPAMETPTLPLDTRVRSSSSLSHHGPVTPIAALTAANRPWSNSVTAPPPSQYNSRPSTAGLQSAHYSYSSSVRSSVDQNRRHDSTATYVTAQSDQTADVENSRLSGIFNSAMPPGEGQLDGHYSPQPATKTPENIKVLFCCASLYEFNIDNARTEAGYPYLTYSSGDIFDVIAQKGELWLAKNQDDRKDTIGWIWEQHFVVLSAN